MSNQDQYALVHTQDGASMERQPRALATAMGANAAVCTYPFTGQQAKQTVISGSISLALAIGETFLKTQTQGKLSIPHLIQQWRGKCILT